MWKNGRHPPMPPRERAKQFMPFAAVRGLEEALAERERLVEERVELQEDLAQELDRVLHELSVGDTVRLEHFRDGRYVCETVRLTRIDELNKCLHTEEGTIIRFDDLRSVEKQ